MYHDHHTNEMLAEVNKISSYTCNYYNGTYIIIFKSERDLQTFQNEVSVKILIPLNWPYAKRKLYYLLPNCIVMF